MAAEHPKFAQIRRWIEALPETSEKLSHGSPTFWGGKKTFASFHNDHHGDGRVAVWCKSSLEAQEALVDAGPGIYFVPPYVGPSGWVGINVDSDIAWEELTAVLLDGYRAVAPKRALKLLDAQG